MSKRWVTIQGLPVQIRYSKGRCWTWTVSVGAKRLSVSLQRSTKSLRSPLLGWRLRRSDALNRLVDAWLVERGFASVGVDSNSG